MLFVADYFHCKLWINALFVVLLSIQSTKVVYAFGFEEINCLAELECRAEYHDGLLAKMHTIYYDYNVCSLILPFVACDNPTHLISCHLSTVHLCKVKNNN